ncbi:ribosome maturation factor RimM [Pantoea sp. Aalb]|uniref:ribosome maturation factor RimM n=1 Tax=Pantoea sp. Aalb TaxID=2576762 RepID=UPI00132102C3|nr:ribosome maturation factor RimM [Pantoea sp. Aalb]MXP67775.1 ribosome maturation factor RimM [Pantoea sp. Aalb]
MVINLNSQCSTQFPINPIILGKIGSAYGIQGKVKVFSSTENLQNIFKYQPWFIYKNNKWSKIEIENWVHHHNNFLIKIKGINDRNAVTHFTNCEIIIDSNQLPILENGCYYWKDLIGCKVLNLKGYNMGTVISLIDIGSHDIFIIKSNDEDFFGIQERLIPFIDGQVVKKIDLITGIIKLDWEPDF